MSKHYKSVFENEQELLKAILEVHIKKETFVAFQLKNPNCKIKNSDDGMSPIPSTDTVYDCNSSYSTL